MAARWEADQPARIAGRAFGSRGVGGRTLRAAARRLSDCASLEPLCDSALDLPRWVGLATRHVYQTARWGSPAGRGAGVRIRAAVGRPLRPPGRARALRGADRAA